ncbi:MAG: cytochrome P450 [Betaproteobacteria bacterium]
MQPELDAARAAYDPGRDRVKVSPLAAWLANPPRWLLWFLRNCLPILRVPFANFAGVFRYDDVAEVLTQHQVFKVPFGEEIARLNDGVRPGKKGTPFILGIDDEREHLEQLRQVAKMFPREDVPAHVARISSEHARARIAAAAQGRMDAIPELITAVPLEVCRRYYGIDVPAADGQRFAYATIDVSGHLFGPPPIEPKAAIDVAANYVRAVVDAAIQREAGHPSGAQTVLARMVADGLERKLVRSFLIGMIVGFVPTNTMAGGHILEVLLRRPKFLAAARQAAAAGDGDLLGRCLFEAMRFRPLNPGPFRVCSADYTLAADTWRAKTIRKGARVLASTMSAMFDSRHLARPRRFDPRRPASDCMLFGFGMHWCAGFFIAQAQIVETFRPLVLQPQLQRAGKLRRRGLFPDHLPVRWKAQP